MAFVHLVNPKARVIFTATQPFATDVINSQRKLFRYDLVWNKTRTTGFLNANRMPLRQHEHLLVFAYGYGTYNPQKTPGLAWKKTRSASGDKNYDKVASNSHVQISTGLRHPTSIVAVPSGTAKSMHPTQKPVALLEWLIKTYTNPGDTVLDPTFGSCTTGVACARLGRNFIGIEKDAGYFRTGRERVDAERSRLGLQPSQTDTVSTSHASKTSP